MRPRILPRRLFSLIGYSTASLLTFALCLAFLGPQATAQESPEQQNPYAYLGTLHNEALDYYIENVVREYKGDPVMASLSAAGYVEDFLCKTLGGRACRSNLRDFLPWPLTSTTGDYNPWEGQTDLPREIREILPYVEKISTIFNTARSFEELDKRLGLAEETILADRKIPATKAGKSILGSLAVGRASCKYWSKHINNPSSPWVLLPGGPSVADNWDIIEADAKGALEGGVGGFEVGGPWGALWGGVAVGAYYSIKEWLTGG